jgi:hypothetical protein
MPLEPKKYLYDIQEGASRIVDFTSGKTLDDYRGNARCAAVDSGEPGWCAYSGALGRKFLRLDQFLKSTSAKAEENVPNPKLFP